MALVAVVLVAIHSPKQQQTFALPSDPANPALSTDQPSTTIKLFGPLPSSLTYQVDGLHYPYNPPLTPWGLYILVRPIGMRT